MPKGLQWSLDDVYNARRQAEIQAEANAQALRREYERQKRDQERERERERTQPSTAEEPRKTSYRPAPSKAAIYDAETTAKLNSNRDNWAKQKSEAKGEQIKYRLAVLKYTSGYTWRHQPGSYGYLKVRYQKYVEELLRKWKKQGFSEAQAQRAIELEYQEEGWRIYEDKYMEAVFAEFYEFVPRGIINAKPR